MWAYGRTPRWECEGFLLLWRNWRPGLSFALGMLECLSPELLPRQWQRRGKNEVNNEEKSVGQCLCIGRCAPFCMLCSSNFQSCGFTSLSSTVLTDCMLIWNSEWQLQKKNPSIRLCADPQIGKTKFLTLTLMAGMEKMTCRTCRRCWTCRRTCRCSRLTAGYHRTSTSPLSVYSTGSRAP